RHPEVHEDDIRPDPPHDGEALEPVTRLADDLDVAVVRGEQRESRTDELLVVDEHDPHGHETAPAGRVPAASRGRTASTTKRSGSFVPHVSVPPSSAARIARPVSPVEAPSDDPVHGGSTGVVPSPVVASVPAPAHAPSLRTRMRRSPAPSALPTGGPVVRAMPIWSGSACRSAFVVVS